MAKHLLFCLPSKQAPRSEAGAELGQPRGRGRSPVQALQHRHQERKDLGRCC